MPEPLHDHLKNCTRYRVIYGDTDQMGVVGLRPSNWRVFTEI